MRAGMLVPPPSGRVRSEGLCDAARRALLMWPRLDRKVLGRCGCDPVRIARYVARRTSLPLEEILTALTAL